MDVQEIKSRLSLQDLLDYYGINGLRQKGNRLSGSCPIHNGDNPNALHISLDKNLWHCFTRNHGGDVLSFIMEYEQVNFQQALDIARKILNDPDYKPCQIHRQNTQPKPTLINPPLKFKLKLDPGHNYLKQRGLTRETIEHFGIGFCERGILKGRIAIPIHDQDGNLVAYAGRSITNEEPKYKFPKGFNKSQVIFNLHRVKAIEDEKVIIVEGFFDCFKIHQAGFPNVVALMGCSITEVQANLILQLNKKLILLLDGDPAGREGTKKLAQIFQAKLPLTIKYLSNGTQPDQLEETELKNLLKERS